MAFSYRFAPEDPWYFDGQQGRAHVERMAYGAGNAPLVVDVILARYDAGEEVLIPAHRGSSCCDLWVKKEG